MKKCSVAVLMGGRTAEHEISMATGQMVVRALDPARYRVKPVRITKRGGWIVPDGYLGDAHPREGLEELLRGEGEGIGAALSRLLSDGVEIVFIAMHGPYGEDGTIQGLFELIDMPYTASGVGASSLAMDKIHFKEILSYHRISTPPSMVVSEARWRKGKERTREEMEKRFGLPLVVKPPRLGSSVGMGIPHAAEEIGPVVENVLKYDTLFIVEAYIRGREITGSVLEDVSTGKAEALPLTEIIPDKDYRYFDYKAKYTPGATKEITPASLDESLTARAQHTAVRVHEIIGCSGMSRTDMILRHDEIFVLEINTIPGMTKTSLLPQAAQAAGISFPVLLDRIIRRGIHVHRKKKACCEIERE